MGARVYDPYTGTFTQPDPIQGGGANAYGYTNADPVNMTDLGGQRGSYGNGCATSANAAKCDAQTARTIRSWPSGGPSVGSTLVHVGENLAAFGPYAAYYGAYQTARAINSVGAHLGGVGRSVAHAIVGSTGLPEVQRAGLAVDQAIDSLKGESTRDEGVVGSIDPLHDWLGSWPEIYLPGVHRNGKTDFEG